MSDNAQKLVPNLEEAWRRLDRARAYLRNTYYNEEEKQWNKEGMADNFSGQQNIRELDTCKRIIAMERQLIVGDDKQQKMVAPLLIRLALRGTSEIDKIGNFNMPSTPIIKDGTWFTINDRQHYIQPAKHSMGNWECKGCASKSADTFNVVRDINWCPAYLALLTSTGLNQLSSWKEFIFAVRSSGVKISRVCFAGLLHTQVSLDTANKTVTIANQCDTCGVSRFRITKTTNEEEK